MTSRTVAGEVRLDNRDELFKALAIRPRDRSIVSDLALTGAAYERWGEACPARLVGDFAFLVSDVRTGHAFGARDPMGVKPFYYRASARGFAFATRASAIGAIDGLPLSLNEVRVGDACMSGLECADRTSTFYRDVFRLPPGHRLRFAAGSTSIAPYWTADPAREIRLTGDARYAEAFAEVFSEAVRCRLSGETASMLSGGLDSSTIVGFARAILQQEHRPPLTTFSALTNDPHCEESRHIRAVSAMSGLNAVAIRPDEVEGFRAEIGAFVASMEEPFDDAMVIPLLTYVLARRRGFDAVLDGLDGDIVASHEPDLLDSLLRAGSVRAAVREAYGFGTYYRDTYAPWSRPARLLAASAARTFAPAFVRAATRPIRQRAGVNAALSASIISRDLAARAGVADRLRALWSLRGADPPRDPRARQAEELTHPQVAAALERYHRVAASQGVEPRHPFFDRRVVEFCLALPWDQKVRNGWTKRIVRLAGEGLVPDEVRWRKGRWVRLGGRFLAAAIGGSRDFLAAELDGAMDELAPYADRAKVRELYRRHLRGDADAGEAAWTAAVLSSWLRNTRTRRYDGGARANGPAALSVNRVWVDGYPIPQENNRDGFLAEVRDRAQAQDLQETEP